MLHISVFANLALPFTGAMLSVPSAWLLALLTTTLSCPDWAK